MRHDFAGLAPSIAVARRVPTTQSQDNSDAMLIARIATGSRLAMQVLFARHHARVYRFILRLVGSEAAAEDLTSDVFLPDSPRAPQSRLGYWAIARYKAIAELRRRPVPDVVSGHASNPADDPETSLAIKHQGEILRNCLTRLSPRHREIIDLVYYHEKSVQEAAEILGVPGNTVKTRMFHARKRFSKLLAEHGVAGVVA
jgi:RNA polymerase sigma-70 factor, ECF subfamily